MNDQKNLNGFDMKHSSSRREKIKVLQAVKEGKLNPANLAPPQVFVFVERSNKPGIYEHEGKEYTETETREFCKRIKEKNSSSIIWNEGRQYPQEDTIIKLCKYANKEPEPGAMNITLDLSK